MQSQVEMKPASGDQGWHTVDGWVNGWDKGVCVCVHVVCNNIIPSQILITLLRSKCFNAKLLLRVGLVLAL